MGTKKLSKIEGLLSGKKEDKPEKKKDEKPEKKSGEDVKVTITVGELDRLRKKADSEPDAEDPDEAAEGESEELEDLKTDEDMALDEEDKKRRALMKLLEKAGGYKSELSVER